MAEPQRASSLDVAASRLHRAPKPRPPHPSRYAAALRLPLDETQDLTPSAHLGPPARMAEPASPEPEALEPPAQRRYSVRARRPSLPSRTPGEWVLIAVLLSGLALNAVALMTNAALTGSDRLLGSAVFLGGLALLVLIEICRRTGCGPR